MYSVRMHIVDVVVVAVVIVRAPRLFYRTFFACFSFLLAPENVVIPSTMQMLDENGQTLRNGTTVGPLSEGRRYVSYCEARSGRPKPNVGWYLNGKRLTGN